MNKLASFLNIDTPIIQGGMVWVSGAKLAAAVSNEGGLGVIGAGSMSLEILDQQLKKAKSLTNKSLAINLPLLYSKIEDQIQIALDHNIDIFITSAGSPKKYTDFLKSKGKKVLHVISHPDLAKKCELAGVDAVIAEGFEAGGHNGRDEITTMCLVPQVADTVNIPVIAAGGIVDKRGIKAALSLGASGVQMGTRFLMTKESRAHQSYKDLLLNANASSTKLHMKSHVPVRLFDNHFKQTIQKMESIGASKDDLVNYLGKGRARLGMHEGDLKEGELEIGQGVSMIKDLPSVKELMSDLKRAFEEPLFELLA